MLLKLHNKKYYFIFLIIHIDTIIHFVINFIKYRMSTLRQM